MEATTYIYIYIYMLYMLYMYIYNLYHVSMSAACIRKLSGFSLWFVFGSVDLTDSLHFDEKSKTSIPMA